MICPPAESARAQEGCACLVLVGRLHQRCKARAPGAEFLAVVVHIVLISFLTHALLLPKGI